MLNDLFNLYKKYSASIVPLEDFTTEALAGLLRLYPDFLKEYLCLIGLPIDKKYSISTQKFYYEERQNCYVDLVLESEDVICFIENKVNSGEGREQLDRYATVLKREYNSKRKYLVYCTKYLTEKQIAHQDINLQLIIWHSVGLSIKNNKEPAIIDFYNYLINKEMTTSYTITPELIFASKKAKEIEIVFMYYMESVKNDFWEILGINYRDNYCITESRGKRYDFLNRNRFANIYRKIIGNDDNYSELIYGIDFERSELFTGFYIEYKHPFFNKLKSAVELSDLNITLRSYDEGEELSFVESMGTFMNKDNCEQLVQAWFRNNFHKLKKFVDNHNSIPWNISR